MAAGPTSKDRFERVASIARGGMGEVELVRDLDVSPPVLRALKRLRLDVADDPEIARMFVDEARIAASLDHPNLVRTFDAGVDALGPFLVMEYIQGFTLSDWIRDHAKSGKRVPWDLCVEVVRQVALGLSAAHEMSGPDGEPLGLVHRDVSPQNILVQYDGRVCLADFGIAKAVGRTTKTSTGVLKGKVGYMSPEQLRFETLDARADLFALGVVLYELACCERLYDGSSNEDALKRTLNEPAPDLAEVRDSAPRGLVELLFRLLAKSPSHRPASAGELANRLAELAEDLAGEADGKHRLREYAARHLAGLRRETRPLMESRDGAASESSMDATRRESGADGAALWRRRWPAAVGLGGAGLLAAVWFARSDPTPSPAPAGAIVIEAGSLGAGWTTPNVIQWSWHSQGEARNFEHYELALSPDRDAVEAFSPGVVLGPPEIPELGFFERPRTHNSDQVRSLQTLGLQHNTVYYARIRAVDVAGETSQSDVVAAKTKVLPSRDVAFAPGAAVEATSRPACFGLSPDETHYRYEVACLANGEGTCETGDETATCWENLSITGLQIDVGKRVPSLLKHGFVEVDIALDDSEASHYAELTLVTGTGRFQASPLALRADGTFHTYQFPLGAFKGGDEAMQLDDLGSIEEFWVGANWTAGGTVRIAEPKFRR